MSAARLLREIARTCVAVLAGLPGWLLIAPLALLIPKRRDWLAVIGRDEGKFLDNAKYFFLQGAPLLASEVRVVFVTERRDVAKLLDDTPYEVLRYPSPRGLWFLLRAKVVVVDSVEWVRRLRRFLLAGAKLMQLWHGVGYKRIELDKWRHEAQGSGWLSSAGILPLRWGLHVFTGRLVRYDAVNSTSRFYRDEVFTPAFLSRHFPIAGYPRNTFAKLGAAVEATAWRNVDPAVKLKTTEWHGQGCRVVLVAPTFRDSGADPLGLGPAQVALLDDYCETEHVEFVFKFHPAERRMDRIRGRHLHLCGPGSDLYPLMPLSSALITDYSSIYMDYLLVDKPVLFFVPDLERYLLNERQFQFDFDRMTPGPKLANWADALSALSQQWRRDEYAEARAHLRNLAFDGLAQDEAVPRLIAFMRAQGWLPEVSETR